MLQSLIWCRTSTAKRWFSLYNMDRLLSIRRKRRRIHPFEGDKLDAKLAALNDRRSISFRETLKDWTRILLQCAAHTSQSFERALKSMPYNMKNQAIVYEIHLSLLAHQVRHAKRLGFDKSASLEQINVVFGSIPRHCRGDPSFASYFLYMDAYCAARDLQTVWKMHSTMPQPKASDFARLILLYGSIGEGSRCQMLLTCVNNLALPVDIGTATKLTTYLARTTPEFPSRRKLVESLIFKYCRQKVEKKSVYGSAAHALLLVSDDPFQTFNMFIQPSAFTVGVLFKRLIDLRQFDCITVQMPIFLEKFTLDHHDFSVIVTRLGSAQQFQTALAMLSYGKPTTHIITTLMARASKFNQKQFVCKFFAFWPKSVPLDAIALTALIGARIYKLNTCESLVGRVKAPDGFLYSRLLYLCRTSDEVSRVWSRLISLGVEPDVFVMLALSETVNSLKISNPVLGDDLHVKLLCQGVVKMRSSEAQWPALLDSVMVVASRLGATHAQEGAYQQLRTMSMSPTGFAVSEMVASIYRRAGPLSALDRLRRIEEETHRIYLGSRAVLLRLSAADRSISSVVQVSNSMVRLGVTPSLHAWNSLLILYSRSNDLARCQDVFERMRCYAKILPNLDSWSALLHIFARRKNARQCEIILSLIRDQRLPLPTNALPALESCFGSLWVYHQTRHWPRTKGELVKSAPWKNAIRSAESRNQERALKETIDESWLTSNKNSIDCQICKTSAP